MTRTTKNLLLATLLLGAAAGHAATFGASEVIAKQFPIDADGSVWIENTVGNIEIVGTDEDKVSLSIQKIVRGVDQAAIGEGREQTEIATSGDRRTRVFRTVVPPIRTSRWNASFAYTLRVPRSVHVKIASGSSDRIRVANIAGSVSIRNVNGTIVLENIDGAVVVDSINGTIVYDPQGKPLSNAQLTTVNGQVEVLMPADAVFRWTAETIRGDIRTSMPNVQGRFAGSRFRGWVNASKGPSISTASMMGNIYLLKKGSQTAQARPVRLVVVNAGDTQAPSASAGPPIVARTIEASLFNGDLNYSASFGAVRVGQVRGNARVEIGAGEVMLDLVTGDCTVTSHGGPLSMGDIFGTLTAKTRAGDVVVNAARSGGYVSTGGGIIRLLYTGGPMELHSEGGDIVVRTVGGPLTAATTSGDITLNVDPSLKTDAIAARTDQGSIILSVSSRFAADIDATVLTSDDDANPIHSDFSGLSIRRERLNGKTKVRATGKINGGGDRVELYSEEGNIHLAIQPAGP